MMLLIYCSRFLHNGVDWFLCMMGNSAWQASLACIIGKPACSSVYFHDGSYAFLGIVLHDVVNLLLKIFCIMVLIPCSGWLCMMLCICS